MKSVKVIAMLDVDYKVELKEITGKHSVEYSVTYGKDPISAVLFSDFKKAWVEFQSCCAHSLECASLIERFED